MLFSLVHHQKRTLSGRQRRLYVGNTKPSQSIPVFDQHNPNLWVLQNTKESLPMPIQPTSNLSDFLVHDQSSRRCKVTKALHLPLQICFLVCRRDTTIQNNDGCFRRLRYFNKQTPRRSAMKLRNLPGFRPSEGSDVGNPLPGRPFRESYQHRL
jgi:hypothetical protein